MNGPGDVWNTVAAKWTEVAGQIDEADWEKPTTCDGWNVKELVDHAMHWQAMGGGVLGAGTEPGQDWTTIQPALAAAFTDPTNLEGNAEAFGGMPKQGVAGLVIGDLLVHTWDLARSIGADDTLPEAAVESTLMGLQRLPDEMLRSENMFGPPVEIAEDASAQDKLIAFVGRQP